MVKSSAMLHSNVALWMVMKICWSVQAENLIIAAIGFSTDLYNPERVKPNDVYYSLIFHLLPQH